MFIYSIRYKHWRFIYILLYIKSDINSSKSTWPSFFLELSKILAKQRPWRHARGFFNPYPPDWQGPRCNANATGGTAGFELAATEGIQHLEGWDVLYNILFCYIAKFLLHNRNLFVYIAFNLMLCYITFTVLLYTCIYNMLYNICYIWL